MRIPIEIRFALQPITIGTTIVAAQDVGRKAMRREWSKTIGWRNSLETVHRTVLPGRLQDCTSEAITLIEVERISI
jgi:hypothetical protein